ncbi:hypothetical protein [Streptosporangium sp. NPDC087985]|uniref:hypothetical protein n=1 Tax=Streptosporangium sp. NPDC087985 TaxID=3366196 RepID=UPI0038202246
MVSTPARSVAIRSTGAPYRRDTSLKAIFDVNRKPRSRLKVINLRLLSDMSGNQYRDGWATMDHLVHFPSFLRKCQRGDTFFKGENTMLKLKSVFAGLAVSTAMAGGIVGLGAATTATAANAGVAPTAVGFSAWGGCGGGCGRRCGGGCGGWGGRREHHRIRVRIVNNNRNTNIVSGGNSNGQSQRNRQFLFDDREDGAERAALAEGF